MASDPRAKNFHSHSISVPIDIPTGTGMMAAHSIPFGPPVMHLEPEKTLYQFPENPLLQSQGGEGSVAQDYFFNPKAKSIFPCGDLVEEIPFGEEEDEKMEE